MCTKEELAKIRAELSRINDREVKLTEKIKDLTVKTDGFEAEKKEIESELESELVSVVHVRFFRILYCG